MNELLQSGLTITAIGMSVVFVLLTALVWIIHGMSALAAALGGTPTTPAAAQTTQRPAAAGPRDDELVAVIAVAVNTYRHRQRSG